MALAAHQSPMISIPKKATEEVDWTTPIRAAISQSYGEDPDNYAQECANLYRCRQDAVKGAGSDITARDLLYKYFGQLELLELRFAEIKVNFPWRDAFTNKLTTQTSIAYEKACIIFQIAATHSAIASSQNRSDPEGLKRAFYYFRTCAGMLTYINDNFLHAPSTDLSREVIKFLVGIILAQATEVFFEKCTDEKKGNALVAKIAAQAAFLYTGLSEEVKEFMGKGIFDRNWVTVIQTKAKYFSAQTQYFRALADDAAGKHGDALVRFTYAETAAKEANRTASSFASLFVTQMSPTLPPDAGPCLADLTKAFLAVCTEKKNEAQRENELIYHSILAPFETLPQVDKTTVATPITIQDVYATPEVQKVIGPDMFLRLIPLSVHESASVYSEEKAKLLRGEVEKAEEADAEVRSALDSLGIKDGLVRFRAIAEGEVGGEVEIPVDVRRWREDIALMEQREPVEALLAQLTRLKADVQGTLEAVSRELDAESRECEAMRVKYDHLWTQAPSATFTKSLRQDLKAHFGALEAASASDQQVVALWNSVRDEIGLLLSPEVEQVFRASTEQGGAGSESLLDLDVASETRDDQERAHVAQLVHELDDHLGRLNKIARERTEVLKDLKEKVHSDDVSHLLLLNRRNPGAETSLFAGELEKFKPFQQRLAATVHHEQLTLQEVTGLWRTLKDLAGRGPGARKWEERERRKKDTVNRFSRARDGYMEARDGLAKGLQFYRDLTELAQALQRNVKSFVAERTKERQSLVGQAETQRRLASTPTSPPPLAEKPRVPPPPPRTPQSPLAGLNNALSSMSLQSTPSAPPPPPSGQPWNAQSTPSHYASPPPLPPQHSRAPSLPPPPPPPPTQAQSPYQSTAAPDPYAALSMFDAPKQPSYPPPPPSAPARPPPPPQQQQYQQQQYSYGTPSAPSPYTQPQRQASYPPPPPPPQQQQVQQQQPYGGYAYSTPPPPPPSHAGGASALPPPPPPISYQSQYGAPPPPPPQQQHQQQQQQYSQPQYQYQGQPPPSRYGAY